jgi:hypothetical protein
MLAGMTETEVLFADDEAYRPDWLIDPILEALVVSRWTDAGYLLAQSAQREERIRAEPFERVAFSVRGLLDGEDEDDEG